MTNNSDLESLATKRVQARSGFVIHALIYLLANGGMFAIWFLTGRGYPWFLWPVVGWGIGVAAHAIAIFIGPGSEIERRAIAREVQRLRAGEAR
jgi:hypothetical protein